MTLKKAKSTTNVAFSEVGWTCAGAIGIDDYFIESQEDQRLGQMRCAFCNQMFGNSESLARSKHMVNIHNFATCDQGARYRYRDGFESHLRGYHTANTDAVSANIPGMKGIFYRHQSEVKDERIESLYGMQQHLESSTASLILESQLRSLMSGLFGASKSPSSNGLNTLNDLRRSLEMLSDVVFSSKSTLESAAILYQAANLVEELSVSFDRTSGNRWTSIPSVLLEKVSPSQGSNDRRTTSTDLGYPSPLGSWCPTNSTEWVVLTSGLKITSLLKHLRNGKSTRDRIDRWMLDVLHKSEHLLIVLRCSTFVDISSTSSNVTAGHARDASSQLWGSSWTQDLLGVFEKHEKALDDRSCTVQSDGAVYSHRDDAVFEGEQFWDDLGINTASYDRRLFKSLR
ncbi:hypothetical protein CTAM01_02664 [Colletotrichum tamarilloi]|uniref:C2H2-type domain-containing protein n=1 Tax=Colletotrichum tamarilloi TaxID=1209934 RepID=A0ABQ9RM24_9PEZI|nr:uncharacterized protein CTAM01_02664 [Colletotrichum tamarilloi]KAK1507552.1 hypothetical protein CTAM01_02664 [Colletotrichum tamarilloi]